MDDSEKALTYNLASTTQGKIFSIEYSVKLIINHQGATSSKNKDGNFKNQIIFPIKIMS